MIKHFAAGALGAAALALTLNAQGAESRLPAQFSGGILRNEAGMTLYTFDGDQTGNGRSACNGHCAAVWPPLAAPPGATGTSEFSLVQREDGGRQWAYRGKPLYFYAPDRQPGDTGGDNVNGVWHVIRDM